jgi:dTDP-4-amino-4,6-dideoxygalactose transaminase
MDAINAIAKEYDLPVIADAAAAIGVNYKGRPIGEVADLTCYSFNGNKTITCGGGGMVVGADEELLGKIKHVSTTARVSRDYDHDQVGYNYRMTNLQAAVGCAQLDRLDDFLEAKTRIRKAYDTAFKDIAGIKPFPMPADRTTTCWFSGFVIDGDNMPTPRDICDQLGEQSIEARVFWKPVHLQAPYSDCPKADMPLTDDLYKNIVTLPCSTNLTEADQARVIDAVLGILKNSRK